MCFTNYEPISLAPPDGSKYLARRKESRVCSVCSALRWSRGTKVSIVVVVVVVQSKLIYTRLNTQHPLIKHLLDGRLYIAPIHLKDGDRVLESGVGTGTSSSLRVLPLADYNTPKAYGC